MSIDVIESKLKECVTLSKKISQIYTDDNIGFASARMKASPTSYELVDKIDELVKLYAEIGEEKTWVELSEKVKAMC